MSGTTNVNGNLAPVLLDDAERENGRNGKEAKAALIAKEANLINQAAYAGHPFYTWVLGEIDLEVGGMEFRQVYSPRNVGALYESGVAIWATNNAVEPYVSGQGVKLTINASEYLTPTPYDDPAVSTYPEDARTIDLIATYGYSTTPTELVVSAVTDNFPQLVSGSLWQEALENAPTNTTNVVGTADIHQKGDIVGERSGSNQHLGTLLSVFNNTFYFQRPQVGWSMLNPGTLYVDFTTSKNAFRYIFNQAVGNGGTSPAPGGPAITLPLSYSAAGLRNQVKVFVFVYAAMSGATDTGSIGVANKDDTGSMATTVTALTNASTINSTSFTWYPDPDAFDHETAQHFLGYAGASYDRVVLCAKSSGSTDSVRIGAVTFIVQHATEFSP